jgi:hypothetical protein
MCADCETYHCAKCVFICICEDKERHYICDKDQHKCHGMDCENYTCRNNALTWGVNLCREHPFPMSTRVLEAVVEYARKHKRVREQLTEDLWEKSKKTSM